VQEELAMLQITDQHPVFKESEVILVPLPEEVLEIASEEGSSTQSEQQDMVVQETAEHSQAYTEYSGTGTSGQEQEYTFPQMDVSDVPANDGDQVMAFGEEVPLPQEETASPFYFTYEPIEPQVEPEFEATPEESSDEEHFTQQEINSPAHLSSEPSETSLETEVSTSFEGDDDTSNIITSEHEIAEVIETSSPSSMENIAANDLEHESAMATGSNEIEDEAQASESDGISSETNVERRPTKPLQVEQPGSPVTVSHDALIQSAKETWIAAESAMQHARNKANGINASNEILTQTEGLSKEFMEELARKQTEANSELLQAQDIARAAYERFVQVQKDAQPSSNESPRTPDDSAQHNQDDNPLPPAEENGLDQTAKLHVAHLYTEW
jgi:hypothetical protein